MKYDFLIIGSGLGGLLCAHILSREGFNVCLVEKNKQLGGCLQTFKRRGCIFDTGVHYVGSLDEGQLTHQFFKFFGLTQKLNLKKMDEDGFDILQFKDGTYKYPMGYERFNESLIERFPQEKEAVLTYSRRLQEVIASLDLYNLRNSKGPISINPHFSANFNDFINSLTTNAQLKNILAGLNMLYAGTPQNTSLYLHATVFHSFLCSAWRLVDGSSQITDLLANDIRNAGGTIVTDNGVKRLHIDSNKIASIEFDDGQQIQAEKIISNAHPSSTIKLIDKVHLKKPYWKRIDTLPNTTSSFTVYVCLKQQTYPYENFNFYRVKSDRIWCNPEPNDTNWPGGYMFLTPATSESSEFASCAIIMTFMDYRDVAQWHDTTIEKRGEAYRAFKQEKAELLLDAVEKDKPGFRKNIDKYYTSTPLTYRDYTATKEGAIYGIARDCNDPIKTYIPPRTKISNLFFTGQNISMHGVLGVTVGAVQTCAEFLGLDYLVNRIRNTI